MTRTKKAPRPTKFQTSILAQIARSPLMKAYSADRKVLWGLANGRAVPERCANALIRNGWVTPQRDGLYGETQTYVALKP